MSKKKEVLNIDDSLVHVRGNFNYIYPKSESRRKAFGSIPERLHDEITAEAKRLNVYAFEFLAGLMDFYTLYEEEHKADLTEQRKKPRR